MKKFFILCLLTCVHISAAHAAHSISFQLGGFIGRYYIDSGTQNTGDKVITLNAGAHTFNILYGGSASFTVNSDGTVVSSNTTVFTFSASTLTLNTVPVYFDFNGYNNLFSLSVSPYQAASSTYYLPIGLSASIGVPGSNNLASFIADQNGHVIVLSGADKIIGSKNIIVFKTVEVIINPGNYDGPFNFDSKPFASGVMYHKLFPNTTYSIKTNAGTVIGTVQTNDTHLVANTTSKLKSVGNTVYLYTNKYTVTPPSGYSGVWQIYYQGNNTGVANEWLLIGSQARLVVGGINYYGTADTNCTSFGISTAVGTFNFDCDDASSLVYDGLNANELNDLTQGFRLYKTDGRLSTTMGDYALSVNGSSHSLSAAHLTNDTLAVYDAFVEGRNALVLDGEDSDSNAFQLTPVFWAGSAEILVETIGEDDTVTLQVDQTIGMSNYNISIVKEAVNYGVSFKNVPSMDGVSISITTSRGNRRVFKSKISNLMKIKL